MISSEQLTNIGESSNTKDFTAGAFDSMQQKQNYENYDSDSDSDSDGDSSIRIHDHNRGSFGDNKLLNRKGKSVLDRAKDETWQASRKDDFVLVRYQSDCNMESRTFGKGKERVSSGEEDSVSISKEREHGHESVENNSSKRLISTCKRAPSPEHNTSELSNSKRQKNIKSSSGSSVRHRSSFINWISTITGGYVRSDQATPLAFLPHPSNTERHLSSVHKSHEKSKDFDLSCRSMGFRSIFQGLYHPSLKVQNSISRDLDIQREVDASKEHEIPREQLHHSFYMVCDNFEHNPCDVIPKTNVRLNSGSKKHFSGESLQLVCDGDSGNLRNRISTFSESLNHGTCHVEEVPPAKINISFSNSIFHEKSKCISGKDCLLSDTGSPCFYDNIAPVPFPGNIGTGIPVSAPNCSSVATNQSFLESLWIRRLSPKVSFAENPAQCNQGVEACERVTNNCKYRNGVSPNWMQSNSGKCHLSEGQKGSVSDEIQNPSMFPVDPCSSKRKQKLNSNLNPILPSQRFKNSEHVASFFAKRLDAFRQIIPSIVTDITTCSTTTCFFCGKSGHSIGKCSDLDETELEDLLKNMDSFDGTPNSSWCIRCFQLDHWAISCPRVSSKRKRIAATVFIDDYEKPGNHNMSCYDGRIILWSGCKEERHQGIDYCRTPRRGNVRETPQRESLRVETELAANSDVSGGMPKFITPKMNYISLNAVKEDVGEGIPKVKPTSSSFGERETKENHITPYCDIVTTEVAGEAFEVFKIIRGLRLSRTYLIRWMKSPVSQFSLEGFFLRLWLGKWEGDLGGTGYHVACINGINYEKSLSVCIGGVTYLVDYRSVSNHDFVEDELKAWWSAILKDGGKPPAIEALNKKIQERIKFGF